MLGGGSHLYQNSSRGLHTSNPHWALLATEQNWASGWGAWRVLAKWLPNWVFHGILTGGSSNKASATKSPSVMGAHLIFVIYLCSIFHCRGVGGGLWKPGPYSINRSGLMNWLSGRNSGIIHPRTLHLKELSRLWLVWTFSATNGRHGDPVHWRYT